MTGETVIDAARRVGADMGMTKPFHLEELREVVTNLIGDALEVSLDPPPPK